MTVEFDLSYCHNLPSDAQLIRIFIFFTSLIANWIEPEAKPITNEIKD